MSGLWIVTLSYATYGLVVIDNKVVDAPPIARWMIGKDIGQCAAWVRSKGGTTRKERWDDGHA